MRSGELRLENALGMHARLAFHFSQSAARFRCSVRLFHGAARADGKELLELLMLEAGPGALLRLETEGEAEHAAYEALSSFLLNDARLL